MRMAFRHAALSRGNRSDPGRLRAGRKPQNRSARCRRTVQSYPAGLPDRSGAPHPKHLQHRHARSAPRARGHPDAAAGEASALSLHLMPHYIDIHELPGITPEQLAGAHAADLQTQEKYGVKYEKYWVNHECGKVFCLIEAPNPGAAEQVHREAHGFLAEKLVEVQPEVVEAFLGGGETNASGTVLLPGKAAAKDMGFSDVVFT